MAYSFTVTNDKTGPDSNTFFIDQESDDKVIPDASAGDITTKLQAKPGLENITKAYLVKPSNPGKKWKIELVGSREAKKYDLILDDLGLRDSDVTAQPTAAEAAPAAAKTDAKAKPTATPSGESGPEEELQQFLAQHINKYYDKIPEELLQKVKNPSQSTIGPRITKGGWGPASSAALAGFGEMLLQRSNAIDTALKEFNEQELQKTIDAITFSTDGNKSSWTGTTVLDAAFPGGDAGLLAYLKFAYVATHPGDQSGYDAAKEMGLSTGYKDNLFPTDPTWRALCRLGAISPFALFAITWPGVSGEVAANSITIDGVGISHGAIKDGVGGITLLFGLKKGDTESSFSSADKPNVWGIDASGILANLAGHNITVEVGEKFLSKSGVTLDWGSIISMVEGAPATTAPAAPAAPAAAAPAAAGRTPSGWFLRTNDITRSGRTVSAAPKAFKLQNIYLDNNGNKQQREIIVRLTKEVRPRGDLFIVEAVDYFILIPALEDGKLVYFPVERFSLLNDQNYSSYGPQGAGKALRVTFVDAEVSDSEWPSDVTRAGDGIDKEAAIARYFLSDRNPVGAPLYLTPSLNYEINSYAKRPPARVG